MAEVWRGKQFGASGFERLVAIKRILPNIAEDEEFISMFIDEAKISVQLTHANIAQIYELGNIAGSYFISMEYIPGKDMRAIFDRCRKKGEPAPVPLVAFCVSKMCEGLDYAHRKKDGMGRDMGIVHRDISPQNILISYEGEVKVIDFGIAKAAGKATKTQAGILKGKFGYMSPEQIRGLPLDRRSDVFAIGVCLYEMLTGERLFVGDSDFSVLEKVRKAEVPPPSTYNRRIPEALEKIVLKSLAKDVDERYQYASELGDDLQRFLITSETIFNRKDLMQYMKSTFAEEVEREKQRLVDYADIKPPEGMLAALEAASSYGGAPAAAPPPAAVPVVQPVVAAPPRSTQSLPPVSAQGVRRSPTLAALPKLTAATAAPAPKEDEVQATQLVSSDHVFDDSPEPSTQPGVKPGANVGRAVTAAQARAPVVPAGSDEEEEDITNRTAMLPPPPPAAAPPPPAAPPRLTQQGLPPVPAPSAAMPPRASMSVPTLSPMDAPPPPGAQRGSRGNDGLPRIVRDVPPPELSQGLPRGALPPEMSQGLPRGAMSPEMSQGLSRSSLPPELSQGLPRGALPPEMSQGLPRSAMGAGRRQEAFQEEEDDQERPTSTVPALAQKGPNKAVLFGGLALLVLLVAGVAGWLMSRNSTGYILVELQGIPSEARSRVQVLLDTQPVPLDKGGTSVVREVPAGQIMVVVSAEGYKTYTTTAEVAEGKGVTRVNAVLESLERKASLIINTTPADAEVSVDGKVVRPQGKTGTFIKNVPVTGAEWVVEVTAPDHRSGSKTVQVAGDEPVEVTLALEPLVAQVSVTVESKPAGATIFVDGKELGQVTPATIVVPATARALELRKKCYDDAKLTVPQTGGDASASLKKQRNCR
jgi:hypothetical protein